MEVISPKPNITVDATESVTNNKKKWHPRSIIVTIILLIKQVFYTIFVILRNSTWGFLKFFFALKASQKLVFIIIISLVCLAAFFTGYKLGEDNIKNQVEDLFNKPYKELFE